MTPSTFPKTDLARLAALPEDQATLALLAALRFVAAGDLTLLGISRPKTDSLVSDGLVFALQLQRRLTDEQQVEVLALRRSGAKTLASLLSVDPASVPYSTQSTCKRSAMFLDHSLAISRFALLLAVALSNRMGHQCPTPTTLLSFEQDADRLSDVVHDLTVDGEYRRQPLVADALAVVQGTRGPSGLLVEIDRGTESPSYLGRKYAGYFEWWRQGGPKRRFDVAALRLLTIASNEKRTATLRDTCRKATSGRAGGLFWFASEGDLVEHGLLAPVWSNLRSAHLPLWS